MPSRKIMKEINNDIEHLLILHKDLQYKSLIAAVPIFLITTDVVKNKSLLPNSIVFLISKSL